MVEAFGLREMREASTREVLRVLAHWKEEPPIEMVVRAIAGVKPPEADSGGMQFPAKPELTQAEYDAMAAAMRGNAEMYGRRRN